MNAGMAAKKAAKKKGKDLSESFTLAPRKRAKKRASRGRPSPYQEEYAEQARKLCRLGATDKEIADFFGVDERTINRWKLAHPEFCQSITRGKILADAEVADRLFMRACGYSHKAIKFATFEGMITDQKEYEEHYPPDTQAAMFWLKNRRSDLWRDKVTTEVTGADGKPIKSETEITLGPDVEERILAAAASACLVTPPAVFRGEETG